ncbi:hypothetical protein K5X82_16820 [Halosquirtibacter xylanolyticus]|uniref:hypothetical protein n=1 Tax=Halosquirtibacter xylanolyticus TaxID=3374599 RepID=UPI0037487A27|nr:hypothetical protein K5X82_16820 [Prolixibacteraceae bacterium]
MARKVRTLPIMELKDHWNRPITHHKYRKEYESSSLSREIYTDPKFLSIGHVSPKSKSVLYADDKYLCRHISKDQSLLYFKSPFNAALFVFIFVSLILAPILTRKELMGVGVYIYYFYIFVICLGSLGYYLRKKEFILNRIDGTITFPGWLWMKNHTMPFSEVTFIRDEKFALLIIRPLHPLIMANINFSFDCFKDISSIVWYMDKNRPLPPGSAFDPYRQEDFDRRRIDGFPPPLYESYVPTPEPSREHEKEKMHYLKMDIGRKNDEIISRWYDSNLDTDWVLISIEDFFKENKDWGEYVNTLKFIFEDGTRVYYKNDRGSIMIPPDTMKYDFIGYF